MGCCAGEDGISQTWELEHQALHVGYPPVHKVRVAIRKEDQPVEFVHKVSRHNGFKFLRHGCPCDCGLESQTWARWCVGSETTVAQLRRRRPQTQPTCFTAGPAGRTVLIALLLPFTTCRLGVSSDVYSRTTAKGWANTCTSSNPSWFAVWLAISP